MTEDDLQQIRREKWHAGSPLNTLEDARDFVASVGLSLLYPLQPPVLLPTFLGAWLGADHAVPGARQAFAEPRARQAEQMVDQLAAGRDVFLSNLLADSVLLVSPAVDRKSTRLNSSHANISYAVFCLKKKKKI